MEEQTRIEEVFVPIYKNSLMVLQTNQIVRAQYDKLSLLEIRLLKFIISQIAREDKDLRTYSVNIIDLAEHLNINKYQLYHNLNDVCRDLLKKLISIEETDENGEIGFKMFHWVETCEYKKGILTIKLSNEIKNHIVGLSEFYTQYEYYDVRQLPSYHSIRLFEILCSYQNMLNKKENKKYNGIEIEENEIVLDEYELKKMICGYMPKKKKDGRKKTVYYENNTGDFIIKVITPAVEAINANSLMRISFRTVSDQLNPKRIKYFVFKYYKDMFKVVENVRTFENK